MAKIDTDTEMESCFINLNRVSLIKKNLKNNDNNNNINNDDNKKNSKFQECRKNGAKSVCIN